MKLDNQVHSIKRADKATRVVWPDHHRLMAGLKPFPTVSGTGTRTALGEGALEERDALWPVMTQVERCHANAMRLTPKQARLTQQPVTSGHLGEWMAAQVFDIELEASAVVAGIDAVSAPAHCGPEP